MRRRRRGLAERGACRRRACTRLRAGGARGREGKAEREGRELAVPQLREKTWEFEAALTITPKTDGPSPEFRNDGLAAMGWTLPASGFATIGMIVMLVVAASRKPPMPMADR